MMEEPSMRYLSDLMGEDIDHTSLPEHWEEINIMGITADSRQVRPGYIFAAVAGIEREGRAYMRDAVEHGAVAILSTPLPPYLRAPSKIMLTSENVRRSLALMAARYYTPQPKWIAAVTGTDGKTSVAHFYQQLWQLMDVPAASIGTLGLIAPIDVPDYAVINTTPDPLLLHRTLKELALQHVNHVAVEASSHGLDQHRLDGAKIRVAGYTNLSRDHLDYHVTEENYFNAKLRLFTEVMVKGGVAVLNADDAHFEALKKACEECGHRITTYGENSEDIKLESVEPHIAGQVVKLQINGAQVTLDIPLIGRFQVMNILCAIGMAMASGGAIEGLCKAVLQLKGVPGRLEQVVANDKKQPIFVDYAHTPGGLESVLTHIRPHVEGKLAVVFGCGGDRDRGKRPKMGEIAARLADVVYVTDDNPRSESAQLIRSDVMAGCPNATEIAGRKEAITEAVCALKKGDALVIAGKGHEKMQIIGDVTHLFDDAEVARMAVS
jgi:UDP-N-acetylmuramoyl-L-alanyl-D-glutamate--2,6-diaminopimelate ligase